MKKLPIIFPIVALVTFGLLYLLFGGKAHANPESFVRSVPVGAASGSATTSPNYMTAGTATTTITFDSGAGNNFALNTAILNIGVRSSTTPISTNSFGTTTLSIRIEQSDNCIDWSLSTSSTLQPSLTEQVGSNQIASTSMAYRAFEITRPPRCMRALIGVQPGSSNNGAVWGQWVGRKENQ